MQDRSRFPMLVILMLAVGSACTPSAPPWQLFASGHGTPVALSPDGTRLYVTNTDSHSVSVFDVGSRSLSAEIAVGLEPVSVVARPDGSEAWVANHVSDSISVIDTDPASPTFHQVVATIQEIDAAGATRFDEPVGIAFADDAKAYVTLSSTDRVAVIDVASRSITGHLAITAEDPRAIVASGGFLYVAAFESGNQSHPATCTGAETFPDCTGTPGIGTRGVAAGLDPEHIVHDPAIPDRDLFVFDTSTDQLVATVEGMGTLLYGMAVTGSGEVWIAQTEARNTANGEAGDLLIDLENRMFENQLGRVSCPGGSCGTPSRIALDPALPDQPGPADSLATPFGIAISTDGTLVVATAAGSSRVFSVDATTGAVLDRLDVGAIPRGIALAAGTNGALHDAWVHNSLEDSISLVHVMPDGSLSEALRLTSSTSPIPTDVREGRIAFNDALASSSGTFSCGSCHPDSNTDQLLWRIGIPCTTCAGDEIRNTQPIRGIRDTLPLHWDGTLGDPAGGRNGTGAVVAPNCDGTDPHTCFRQLVDAALGSVMCDQADGCPSGGLLSDARRDAMASFLPHVSHPPARERAMSDVVSTEAVQGFFDLSFFNPFGIGSCGSFNPAGCHALPLGASTDDGAAGFFDAPSLRGLNDRVMHFSNGGTGNLQRVIDVGLDPADGLDEFTTFAAAFPLILNVYGVPPEPIFQMVQEGSVGQSGAFARQVTIDGNAAFQAETSALLDALELASAREVVVVRGEGQRRTPTGLQPYSVVLGPDGFYTSLSPAESLTRAELLAEADAGDLLVTLTARHGPNAGRAGWSQPLLWTTQRREPTLTGNGPASLVTGGTNVREGSRILVNGAPVSGTVECIDGEFSPVCTSETLAIELDVRPATGCHLMQIQNPGGLLSNELYVCS